LVPMYHGSVCAARLTLSSWFRSGRHVIDLVRFFVELEALRPLNFTKSRPYRLQRNGVRPHWVGCHSRLTGDEHDWINCPLDPQRTAYCIGLADDRVSGLGSLGRERFMAIADWDGGKIARETKPVISSACLWANGDKGYKNIFYENIIANAKRAPDPFLKVRGRWIVRRLAPLCTRIELTTLPRNRDEKHLLQAMGFETANIHLGNRTAIKPVLRDLTRRKSGWLNSAAEKMTDCVMKDWEEWRRRT